MTTHNASPIPAADEIDLCGVRRYEFTRGYRRGVHVAKVALPHASRFPCLEYKLGYVAGYADEQNMHILPDAERAFREALRGGDFHTLTPNGKGGK